VLPAGYALFFGREPKRKDPPAEEQGDDKTIEAGNVYKLPLAAE